MAKSTSPTARILAAEQFVQQWSDPARGREISDTQTFWNQFLQDLMQIPRVHHIIEYEKPVRIGRSAKRIDAYIAESRVLIEQKSVNVDLDHTDSSTGLTPYEQALNYAAHLPTSEQPRYIVTSNFQQFRIYDRENDPSGHSPVTILLTELPQQLTTFSFITDPVTERIIRQQQLNLDAARLIGEIYAEVSKQYDLTTLPRQHPVGEPVQTANNPNTDDSSIDSTDDTATTISTSNTPDCSRHDLAVLMVRLLFCLYAEDAGLFEQRLFHNYLLKIPAGEGHFRRALIDLFKTLNTPLHLRDTLPTETLSQFPYVNGGLFAHHIEIPVFTNDIKFKLLHNASEAFNWSEINPVIFGSIFESILSGDQRRAGGMHYTSVDNIHKVIDPLFLNDLRARLNAAGNNKAQLRDLQNHIASLNFLDPACGSGNFLTQTYLELRSLEDDILKRLHGDQMAMDFAFDAASDTNQDPAEESVHSLIRVNVGQFYGIEINDFAVSVANAALWIADHQANLRTAAIIRREVQSLPLKDFEHIVVANALRIDWNEVLPAAQCNYIMGNPPFLGYSNQSPEQKSDMLSVYVDENSNAFRNAGKIDYVAGWYYKAAQYIQNTQIRAALVSTNSITQGEQVAAVWKPLYDLFSIEIIFAHRTFDWTVDHANAAAVHCVIVGFVWVNRPTDSARNLEVRLNKRSKGNKNIFEDGVATIAQNINPYLLDAPNIFVERHNSPLSDAPSMITGNRPADGGHLIIEDADLSDFIEADPLSQKYIRRFMGSDRPQ